VRRRDAELFGDVQARERTVGHEPRRGGILERACELLRVLSRELVVLALHSPGAVERGATLDRLHARIRNEREERRERRPDVLCAEMTRDVVPEHALWPDEVLPEAPRAVFPRQELSDVEGPRGDATCRVAVEKAGPLLLDGGAAGGPEHDDRDVALDE